MTQDKKEASQGHAAFLVSVSSHARCAPARYGCATLRGHDISRSRLAIDTFLNYSV
jgi:hypothetical protein